MRELNKTLINKLREQIAVEKNDIKTHKDVLSSTGLPSLKREYYNSVIKEAEYKVTKYKCDIILLTY